jgi:predicted DNA-binding transcriptional regulator YafY
MANRRVRRGRRVMRSKEQYSNAARYPMERMMLIHKQIIAGGYPNAATLAEDFEVSTKSIYRDMEFMKERLGLPWAYSALHNGYYYTGEVRSFPSIKLTEGELFAMVVAEKALQQYRGTPFEKPLIAAFDKMAQSLPDKITVRWDDWDRTIAFRTSAEPVVNLELFDALAKATASQTSLRISYQKPGKAFPDLRLIDPWQLANVDGEWFLFAWDHLRKDMRTFVPARIKTFEVTNRKFKRPQTFSVERHLKDSFSIMTGKEKTEVVLRFSEKVATYIREKKWHSSQKLKELKDGSVEVSMVVSVLDEVQRWVLGWGGECNVIKPQELKNRVREAALRIADLSR